MITSYGWPRLLQEAMQSEKVHELNDEVADVLYNHGTYDLFFTFLQAIHHNLLELVLFERLADFYEAYKCFQGLV